MRNQSHRLLRCLALFSILVASPVQAEQPSEENKKAEQSEEEDPGGFTGLPIAAYSPETSALFGAIAMYRFDVGNNSWIRLDGGTKPRKSVVQALGFYTLKKQMIASLEPSIYLDGEKWRLSSNLTYLYFPDLLYPLGQDSPDEPENYGQRLFVFTAAAENEVVGKLRFGAAYELRYAEITDAEEDGLLGNHEIPGSRGGFVVGAGPTLAWDDRDTDTATRRGGRHEIRHIVNTASVGSEYRFTKTQIQSRQFFPTWHAQVLALELYVEMAQGSVPFQLMAQLGGEERMRGYYSGRYRDLNQVVAQAEYRIPIWWRFGAVAFMGAGNVGSKMSRLKLHQPKFSGGAGLRFSLSPEERVNLRVDFAATREGKSNLYIGLAEAF